MKTFLWTNGRDNAVAVAEDETRARAHIINGAINMPSANRYLLGELLKETPIIYSNEFSISIIRSGYGSL